MQKQNYQKILDKTLEEIRAANRHPSLLLHACCAPCSSYCLEYLSGIFNITVFYYNPNITSEPEYRHRVNEMRRFLAEFPAERPVHLVEGEYDPDAFFDQTRSLEKEPERGSRCRVCYQMRLKRTAEEAVRQKADFFTTTLSISPMKNADWLNEIGAALSAEYGVPYLTSDFKKRGGYQRSIELSAQYGLYRQNYCGCVYSRRDGSADTAGTENSMHSAKTGSGVTAAGAEGNPAGPGRENSMADAGTDQWASAESRKNDRSASDNNVICTVTRLADSKTQAQPCVH